VRRLTEGVPPAGLLPVSITPPATTGLALMLRSPGGWTESVLAGLPSAALVELLRCLK
jgi:hypothetical protein